MTCMVIPVSQHKLIKIRKRNRLKLTKLALYCSTAGALCNFIGSATDSWISTSEVLKYYVFPNTTLDQIFDYDTLANQPVYFKNATMGPWKFCWLDPVTEFHCHSVQYFTDEDPSDVTTSVQQTVRRAFFFMVSGVLLDALGALLGFLCAKRRNPYGWLLCSSIIHIFAGIANFMCILVYMAAVSREVGNKIYPVSELDDPLFHYNYGFSFILVKCSFLLTETAALFTVVVFMAKRDERTFHRYKLRSLMNFKKITETGEMKTAPPEASSAHGHARFAGKNRVSFVADRPSLDHIYQPPLHGSRRGSRRSQGSGNFLIPTGNITNISPSKGVPNRFPIPLPIHEEACRLKAAIKKDIDDQLATVVIL